MPLEYRTLWQIGGSSNPGFSVHHGRAASLVTPPEAAQHLADRVHALWSELVSSMPDDVEISFSGEVLDINTSTGVLEDVIPVTPGSPVVGLGTGAYAAPAGARIEWRTAAIVAGRRLRGRTFVVPLSALAYEGDGTLAAVTRTAIQDAADDYWDEGLFADAVPVIWSRTHGIAADIAQAVVPDEVTVLRSRRD